MWCISRRLLCVVDAAAAVSSSVDTSSFSFMKRLKELESDPECALSRTEYALLQEKLKHYRSLQNLYAVKQDDIERAKRAARYSGLEFTPKTRSVDKMNRKAGGGKSVKAPTRSQQGSTVPTQRPIPSENLQLLPDMPAFFPDPVALDVEDNYLKIFRDELFQREYEKSVKALRYQLEGQGQQQERFGGTANDHVLLQDHFSVHLTDEDNDQVSEKRVLNGLCSVLTERSPALVPVPDGVKVTGDVTVSLSRSGALQKREMSPASKEFAEQSLRLGGETMSIVSVLQTTDGIKSKVECYGKERAQPRWCSLDRPVFFAQPFPPALYTFAGEVGVKNVTTETRVAAMSISEALKQSFVNIIPPIVFPPIMESHTTEVPESNAAPTGISTTSIGLSLPVQQPSRYVSTFPLADAFVLEAEEHLAAEMFCASVCEYIVGLAADMYVSRSFDAMATAYTALSVWDEVHDSVIRSFVCCDPLEPFPKESAQNFIPPIRRVKLKPPVVGEMHAVGASIPKNMLSNLALNFSSTHLPWLGILPGWASAPSVLDADTILSFHYQGGAAKTSFFEKENQKQKKAMDGSHGSTFSRLLTAPLMEIGKKQPASGVLKAHSCHLDATVEINKENGLATGDGDDYGIPPNPIPMDNYARYVVPRITEDSKLKETREDIGKGVVAAHGKLGRRKTARKSQTSMSVHSLDNVKEGDAVLVSASCDGALALNDNQEPEIANVGQEKDRKSRQRIVAYGDAPVRTRTSSSKKRTISRMLVEDDFTKAIRQLPSGFLDPSQPTNGTGPGVRSTVLGPVVLIEEDNAIMITRAPTKKKRQHQEKQNSNNTKPLSLASPHDTNSSLLPESAWVDDGTAMLSVNITRGGHALFHAIHKEPSNMEEASDNAKLLQQPQVIGQKRVSGAKGHVFLTREQQQALEDRRRRLEELAEKAAYESMFFTVPPPTADAAVGGDNIQAEAQLKEVNKIQPVPGVIVKRWPHTPLENKKKTAPSKEGKLRGRLGKSRSDSDADSVLADGGEWLLPDGKHRWIGPDIAAKGTRSTLSRLNAASDMHNTLFTPLKPEQRRPQEAEGKTGTGDKNDIPAASPPISKSPVALGARPVRRPPEMISIMVKDNKSGKKKRHGEVAIAEAVSSLAVDSKAPGENHGAKKKTEALNLPRLPRQPSSTNRAKVEISSSLKTQTAAERDNIRQMASALMNSLRKKRV